MLDDKIVGSIRMELESIMPNYYQINCLPYLQSFLLLLAATFIGFLLRSVVDPTNLVMLYLLGVVIAAVRWGYGPAVLLSALSVLAFNFFFVPHEYTLQVANAQYLLTFAGLFVVGVVIADLTNRVRQQAAAAQRREAQTAELYALSRDLVATISLDKIVNAVLRHVSDTFHVEAAILLYENNQLQLYSQTPSFHFDSEEQQIAELVYSKGQSAGCGTLIHSQHHSLCLPLITIQEKIGILALQIDTHLASRLEQGRLMDAFANQAALAIETARLAEQAQQAQLLREREKLHSSILNSISHDLRTPLVSIAGALSTLRDATVHYDEMTKRDLLDGAWLETQRLNRIVANLLDMSRLQTGAMQLKRNWYDIQELIAISRSHLLERISQRSLKIDVPSDLALVQMDLPLMVQVVTNLLDNALKYSENDTVIEISAWADENYMQLEIADKGSGIPEQDLPHIFETFYRAHRTGCIGGTGLGLSICEGIVSAHQGKIEAKNRVGGGAVFSIRLPIDISNIAEKQEGIGFEYKDQSIDY
jgi:two-component system sensor histidine kinase KdpD